VWVVNGRISDTSYRGYRKVRYYFRKVSDYVLQFFVQTSEDAERLDKLGVKHVQVLGSAKFDLPVPSDTEKAHAISAVQAAGLSPEGMFWVMGSTWPGEEGPLMDIFVRLRQQHPTLQAILVPRHAERGDEVEDMLKGKALSYVRRSKMERNDAVSQSPSVLLADTTGELAGFYMLADIVFVGKSLAGNRGGQNPAEPASMGKPVVTGPAMDNFTSVMRDLLGASAILVAHDFRELEDISGMLLADRASREEMGTRASAFVRSHRGVMQKSAHLIFSELEKRKR
jgi:3-deoxy-D-manno-octulosonic-acid transferase